MEADLTSPFLVAYHAVRTSIILGVMDVNTTLSFKFCETPMLQLAIFFNDKPFIDHLLSHDVDIEQKSKYWGTALHQAVKMQKVKLVKKLVKAGADLNARHPRDRDFTPLHLAVEDNSYKVAKVLVNHGADVEILSTNKDNFGDSPLQLAIRSKNEKMINLLLKNIKCSSTKLTYRTFKLLMKEF